MKNNTLVYILGAVVVVLVVLPMFGISLFKPSTITLPTVQSGIQSQGGTTQGQIGAVATSATTWSIVATDALKGGTILSPGSTDKFVSINGGRFTTATTSGAPGSILDAIINVSGYHNAYVKGHEVLPFSDPISVPMLKGSSTSLNITVFNTNNAVITNSKTGATNQTVASGGAYNMQVRFDGTDNEATGALRCILESTDGTKMDKAILNGLGGATYVGMAKPSSYTLAGAGSQVWVYDVPSVDDANSVTGTLSVTSKSAQSLGATLIRIYCASKEYYLDPLTGTIGFDIEDSAGTSTSKGLYGYWIGFT